MINFRNMTDFWRFVKAHLSDEPSSLRLRYHDKKVPEVDTALAILQIECRKKYKTKFLETFRRDEDFLIPTALVAQQSTSDLLAQFHSELAKESRVIADLTAGLGIDVWHLADKASSERVYGIEILKELAEALDYNMPRLNVGSKTVIINDDCREWLKDRPDKSLDLIFIDPARRDENGKKLVNISDCSPDIVSMLPVLKAKSKRILVKLSPMLDISAAANALGCNTIYIVGTVTECKELICDIDTERDDHHTDSIDITAATLFPDSKRNTLHFDTLSQQSLNCETGMPTPGDFIIEPYPAVMKSGASGILGLRYGLKKPANNTNIYFIGKNEIDNTTDYPGTKLEIVNVLPYSSGIIKRLYKTYPVAEIATRNFKVNAASLQEKLKIRQGASDIRIFGITTADAKPYLIVTKTK